jgi:hypothetical protein
MPTSRRLLAALTILGAIAVLLTFYGSAAAEDYDITNCSSTTITPIASGQDLTAFVADSKGITRASPEKKAFDNNSFHCVSLVRLTRGQRSGSGFCRFVDPDGDSVVGDMVLGPTDGTWTFAEGTGKWKGIKGGGKFVGITSAKPSVPGTAQAGSRATGNYEITK